MKVFEGKRVPIKSWCNNPEEGAVEQAINLSSLPFIFKQVCLMPDTHQGYGMPIGGVIACKNVIIPNAVGVDIGCGMIAVKTDFLSKDLPQEDIEKIFGGGDKYKGGIRSSVPVGYNHRKKKVEWEGFDNAPDIKVIQDELQSASHQLGTLGGGNHFIEIQKDRGGYIWIMIHSGSRNIGYRIAKHYNNVAMKLCKKWYSNIPEIKGEDGLAFLPIDTDEGQEYLTAMNFAIKFAEKNRLKMMEDVKYHMNRVLGCKFEEPIHINHNYARQENHFGRNVWVHRKGATSAKELELGIIPGSQGTKSYIVKGKGNPESFMSCSHGAGRKMSRTKARAELDLEEEQKKLDDKGIIHSIRNKKDLDEASSAYKDIDIVMKEQEDLVEIVEKLEPLAVIKG